MDYLNTTLHLPLMLGRLLVTLWWMVQGLPWPSPTEWFRWLLFLILGKLVWYTISTMLIRRPRYRNHTLSEHGAAAGVSTLFDR